MKYYICSDIHGATTNLNALLEKIGDELQSGAAKLVLLGDIYNHGPRNPIPEDYAPMKVAEALNKYTPSMIAVKGNCDSEVDEMISEFKIYAGSSTNVDGHSAVFTHGHKCNPDLPREGLSSGDIVFYGHFHRATHSIVDGVHYVCVGALGIYPEDAGASYAVFDGKAVAVYPIDGSEPIISFALE